MNTTICPKCGNENKNTDIRCEKCGEQLIAEDAMKDIDFNTSFYIHNAKTDLFFKVYTGIEIIIGGLIISVISAWCVFKGANDYTRIICLPILLFGILLLISGIIMIIKGINMKKNIDDYADDKLDVNQGEKDFEKPVIVVNKFNEWGFLLFWFSFLTIFDILAIKCWEDGGNLMFFFSIIFWIIGIYGIIYMIKQKK